MPGVKVSDPSRLHLKKELTQIRKAARVLRDPGTVSSWKSPLSSSRSAAMAVSGLGRQLEDDEEEDRDRKESHLESRVKGGHGGGNMRNGKEKKVFLYNWRTQKSSSERSGMGRNGGGDEEDENESCSVQESLDDSLSDARNAGETRRGEGYLVEPRSASMIFRCRDAGLVSPAMRRANAARRKGKKSGTRLDVLSRYQQKEKNLRKLLKSHPSIGLALEKNGSLEQSDDTEEYSNSEDPGTGKLSAASPSLLLSKQKNSSYSASKLLRRSDHREESSYSYGTPTLSASSYNRYLEGYPSVAGSWDATTASFIDDYDDEEGDDQLDFPGSRGCGIPCYWSRRTPRHRDGCGSCCSSSISDTFRRKRGNILRGNRSIARARQHSSHKIASKSARGLLPLLTDGTNHRGGSSLGTRCSDDETSTNFGELDLEALSWLDGRRWSSCRSQDGLEIVPRNKDGEEEGSTENIRSLSQKYKPFFFDELIGQNIVVQSLVNAISRRRIAPVYLFQGPRGTGKTSTARIFGSALNCRSDEETKPCGCCRECTDVISGKSKYIWEIDGTRKNEIDKVRHLFKKVVQASPSSSSHYTVFIIDECHLLPSRMWLAFLKLFEEPMQRVVFIFVTTDIDNVPRTVQSQCQRYIFNKIKEGDAVARLRQIANKENLDVNLDALDLIALNADGSLRDAETMLDQLSLLGKRITTSLVNELLGVVPDEKLLELLELAMSSDTSETVKRARDLMNSGVDPLVLMSQMAGLIMDIIAGMHTVHGDTFFGGRIMSEAELERLKRALKLLLEAEKQLRVSNDRATWFTAALLQLSSVPSLEVTQSSSSRRLSSRSTDEDHSSTSREAASHRQKFTQYFVRRSSSPTSLHKAINKNAIHSTSPQMQLAIRHASSTSQDDDMIASMLRSDNLNNFNDLWEKCIEKCHSKRLRQLLRAHGNLLSVSKAKGVLVAYVAFSNEEVKARAERFLSSITNSIETVLRKNVEVRIVCVPDGDCSMSNIDQVGLREGTLLDRTLRSADVSGLLPDGNNGEEEKREEIPMQRIESIIREQRLETAWLQAAEKGTPRSVNRSKPEKNQIMPQEDMSSNNQIESPTPTSLPPQHWEDELNHELRVLTAQGQKVSPKNYNAKQFEHPISPSLLHSANFAGNSMKENLGYESSSAAGGCSSFLCCWNCKSFRKAKARRTPVHPAQNKGGHFHIFGKSRKHRRSRSRSLKQTREVVSQVLRQKIDPSNISPTWLAQATVHLRDE